MQKSRGTQDQSDDARVESQTRRSQRDRQAERRITQRQNMSWTTEMPSDEDGEKAPNKSTEETLEKQTACRACDVLQAVSGMESMPGEQLPVLNATLLSMIKGVQDATNP